MESETEVIAEGCIWKKILTPGNSRISQKPSEGSVCLLKIENLKRQMTNEESKLTVLSEILREQHTTILTGDSEVTVVIGEVDCELDKRIERAIQQMKDNECALITVSLQDPITSLETEKISFEATLLKYSKFKPIWEWTPEEKYAIAMKYKNVGVKLFKGSENSKPRFKDAFYRFSKACKILISMEPIDDLELDKELYDNIQALRSKLYCNMAACQAKYNNYNHVIQLCDKVLERNQKDVLALFRRGHAYGELKDYDKAVQDYTALVELEPTNKQALTRLQHYRSSLRQANINCNEMIKRMFKT